MQIKVLLLLTLGMFFPCFYALSFQLTLSIVDDTGEVVYNAQIILENQEGLPIEKRASPQTGKEGALIIKNLSSGTYCVHVSKIGYEPFSKRILLDDRDKKEKIVLKKKIQILEEVVVTQDAIQSRKKEKHLNVEVIKKNFIHKNLGGSLMQSLKKLPGVGSIDIGSGQSKPL